MLCFQLSSSALQPLLPFTSVKAVLWSLGLNWGERDVARLNSSCMGDTRRGCCCLPSAPKPLKEVTEHGRVVPSAGLGLPKLLVLQGCSCEQGRRWQQHLAGDGEELVAAVWGGERTVRRAWLSCAAMLRLLSSNGCLPRSRLLTMALRDVVAAHCSCYENWCGSAASVLAAGQLTQIHMLGSKKRFSVWLFFG